MRQIKFHLIGLFCMFSSSMAVDSASYSEQNVQVVDAFIQNHIVPDVIDMPPQQLLMINFNGTKAVTLGTEMKPGEVTVQPNVSWPVGSADTLYTLADLDPDAPMPGNATFRCVLHWMVNNIRGNDILGGDVYASYTGSVPVAGIHRYVWLALPQTRRLILTPLPSGDEPRLRFNLRSFVLENGPDQPVAGNFYLAQPDEYSQQYWAAHGNA